MLGVRLTKYQQIHSDIQCAPNVYMFVYALIGTQIVPLKLEWSRSQPLPYDVIPDVGRLCLPLFLFHEDFKTLT